MKGSEPSVRSSTVSQEAFIEAWIALGESYDEERDRLADELQAVAGTRPKVLDMVWLQRKRAATVSLRKALADRTLLQDKALLDLLASSQAIEAEFQEWLVELPWCDWAVDALERAVRVRRVLDERALGKAAAEQAAKESAASGHDAASSPAASSHTLKTYLTYFCGAAGRDPKEGAPGIGCNQPPLPPNWQAMDDVDWARWWLLLGGFLPRSSWMPMVGRACTTRRRAPSTGTWATMWFVG